MFGIIEINKIETARRSSCNSCDKRYLLIIAITESEIEDTKRIEVFDL